DARGERGVFRLEADEGELFGSPAVVESERGTMEAPSVLYTRGDGLVQGRGGVRARLDPEEGEAGASVLEGSPLGGGEGGEGALWVEAERGFFRDEPRAFLFAGSVRAWRGDDLLVANRLLGEETEGRLVASGDVRTVWRPEEESPGEDGGEARAAGGEGGPEAEGPLEATADELVYEREERLLIYTGDVVAEQAERVLSCREMEVHLNREGATGGSVGELVCTGDARLEDPANGRTLEGHRLVYDPEARLFEAVGADGGAVTLEDATGNVIEGPRMIYDIDADEVRVLGRQGPEPAPGPAPASEDAPEDPGETGGSGAP
ncbi:MAG: LptA/OstA family protein, partial [bacterium]